MGVDVQEEKPIVRLVIFARAAGVADLMGVLVVLLGQVLHDAARLEKADGVAVGESVG